ncbi:MAG: nitroreductase family protein [Salinivirgaceae bacterium]|nr:nitroreductase family protein [Salinivirgaceae bacterium]
MDAIDAILTRASVRKFLPQKIDAQQVEMLLRAAMSAPSAGNKQPWQFVVITSRDVLLQISAQFPTAAPLNSAPLAIVVCGDLTRTFSGEGIDYWVEDTSAATQNILLAAHAMNLGAVWCGIYPLSERVNFLRTLLRLPDNICPLGVVAVGYAAEKVEPKDKWNTAAIHYNVF